MIDYDTRVWLGVLMINSTGPPFGYCDTCGHPLLDLICEHCGEVYD